MKAALSIKIQTSQAFPLKLVQVLDVEGVQELHESLEHSIGSSVDKFQRWVLRIFICLVFVVLICIDFNCLSSVDIGCPHPNSEDNSSNLPSLLSLSLVLFSPISIFDPYLFLTFVCHHVVKLWGIFNALPSLHTNNFLTKRRSICCTFGDRDESHM